MKFVGHAYLNRRYTRLAPTLVIATGIGLAYLVAAGPTLVRPTTTPLGLVTTVVAIALQAALYPFAREVYYRFSGPIRHGAPLPASPFPLTLLVYLGKLITFLALITFTVPIGTIGFVYLAVTEHRGRGWRLQ